VLVVAGNVLSRRINPAERASCILFADAAGTLVLAPTERPGCGLLGASLAAEGNGYDLIKIEAGGSRRPFAPDTPVEETLMTIPDGQAVFSRAVDMMVATSREALGKAKLTIADIDWLIPHQANARIMAAVAGKLGVPEEKMISTVACYGNSSAATIPFSLALAVEEGRIKPGDRILMCAAGAGLTGGAVVLGL
jgi:3-oxoacyl-[acyl-carrier-protein] synthase-3